MNGWMLQVLRLSDSWMLRLLNPTTFTAQGMIRKSKQKECMSQNIAGENCEILSPGNDASTQS